MCSHSMRDARLAFLRGTYEALLALPLVASSWRRQEDLCAYLTRNAVVAIGDNRATLLFLVNLGCIDLNPHPVRADDLEHPDELRVDLGHDVEDIAFGLGVLVALLRWLLRALDAEGTAKVRESVERDGTRHRSAYRLCNFVHEALAIVVSQDGTVRFVKWHEGEVTYWDHVSTSVLDV